MSAKIISLDALALPSPPRHIDARATKVMGFDVEQLRRSGMGPLADGETFRAAVMLWLAAFHEVPAGSLPNDDGTLCGLAGLGRDRKTWERVRGVATNGFMLHADGRLYHRGVVQRAIDSQMSTPIAREVRTAGIAGVVALDGLDTPGQQFTVARHPPRGTHGTGRNTPSTTDSQDRADSSYRGDRGVRGVNLSRKSKLVMEKTPKKIGTSLPDGWTPSDSEITYGRHLGLSDSRIAEIAEDMRVWAGANANRSIARKLDWGLTFKGFMRRERDKERRRVARSEERAGGRGFFRRAADAAKEIGDDQGSGDNESE